MHTLVVHLSGEAANLPFGLCRGGVSLNFIYSPAIDGDRGARPSISSNLPAPNLELSYSASSHAAASDRTAQFGVIVDDLRAESSPILLAGEAGDSRI